jgi:hypothetical protein
MRHKKIPPVLTYMWKILKSDLIEVESGRVVTRGREGTGGGDGERLVNRYQLQLVRKKNF